MVLDELLEAGLAVDRGGGAVRTGYRWRQEGRTLSEGRGRLPWAVAPGESVRLQLTLATPESPGVYRLEVGILWEHLRWFTAPDGSPLFSQEVEVLALQGSREHSVP